MVIAKNVYTIINGGKKFIPSIINLGIELAVARYFTKKVQ